jgi:hypothetical protein
MALRNPTDIHAHFERPGCRRGKEHGLLPQSGVPSLCGLLAEGKKAGATTLTTVVDGFWMSCLAGIGYNEAE